jgi:hypothetical protein
MIEKLLRAYSYLVHTALSALLTGLGIVTNASQNNANWDLDLLPWSKEADLKFAFLVLGLFGLLTTGLAIRGKLPLMFLGWTLGILFLVGRAFFVSHYFDGQDEFLWSAAFVLGVFATVLGAISAVRAVHKRR